MAYARLGIEMEGTRASDVYVYMHYRGWLQCENCAALYEDGKTGAYQASSTASMISHLKDHTVRGHHVPDYVIPELEADDAENFPPATRCG